MEFIITPDLYEYMKRKNKEVIAVEVMGSDTSDFEYHELYVHFISSSRAQYFIEKRHAHEFKVPQGRILLPNYKLSYGDKIVFSLKKRWIFHSIGYDGINL